VKGFKATTLPRGRHVPTGELRAILAACKADTSANGIRDTALLAISYGAGVRRSELVAFDLADYSREDGTLNVLHGKGNKARVVFLPAGSRDALDRWLEVRGAEPGALFVALTPRGGKLTARRLNAQGIMNVLLKRAAAAGVSHIAPHDLRRTFIGDLLTAGADIATVQQMAGHASVTTTARYDRRGDGAKRKAADLLHVPI
jgi:site-specific recombinase XerD